MSKERGIYLEADQAVTEYVNKELSRTIVRVEKIRANDGACNCPNCMKEAVSDANNMLDWFCQDDDVYEAYHYEIVADERGIHIEQGISWPKEVFNQDTDTGLIEQ